MGMPMPGGTTGGKPADGGHSITIIALQGKDGKKPLTGEQLSAAMNKAVADGTFDPSSSNCAFVTPDGQVMDPRNAFFPNIQGLKMRRVYDEGTVYYSRASSRDANEINSSNDSSGTVEAIPEAQRALPDDPKK